MNQYLKFTALLGSIVIAIGVGYSFFTSYFNSEAQRDNSKLEKLAKIQNILEEQKEKIHTIRENSLYKDEALYSSHYSMVYINGVSKQQQLLEIASELINQATTKLENLQHDFDPGIVEIYNLINQACSNQIQCTSYNLLSLYQITSYFYFNDLVNSTIWWDEELTRSDNKNLINLDDLLDEYQKEFDLKITNSENLLKQIK